MRNTRGSRDRPTYFLWEIISSSTASSGEDEEGKSFYFLLCYFSFWFLPFLPSISLYPYMSDCWIVLTKECPWEFRETLAKYHGSTFDFPLFDLSFTCRFQQLLWILLNYGRRSTSALVARRPHPLPAKNWLLLLLLLPERSHLPAMTWLHLTRCGASALLMRNTVKILVGNDIGINM